MAWLFGNSNATKETKYTGVSLQTSSRGVTVPIVYGTNRIGTNLLWYGDFVAKKVKSSGKGGALSGGKASGGHKYSAAVVLGLCEGPISGIGTIWASDATTTVEAIGATVLSGAVGQDSWGYLSAKHPSEAVPYSGIAYLGIGSYQLGSTNQLPNHNFEVSGFLPQAPMGDADPSEIIVDILTNTRYGIGLSPLRVGDVSVVTITYSVSADVDVFVAGDGKLIESLCVSVDGVPLQSSIGTPVHMQYRVQHNTPSEGYCTYTFGIGLRGRILTVEYAQTSTTLATYSNYVNALGLYVSPAFTSQESAATKLQELAKLTNSEFYCVCGCISIRPYGNADASSGDYTYTAPTVPVAVFSYDDYMQNGSGQIITVTRKRASDCDNVIKVEYSNRSNNYNSEVVSVFDAHAVSLYGRRENTSAAATMITTSNVAMMVADLLLQRSAVRNMYEYYTDLRYSGVSLLDLVHITDVNTGLSQFGIVKEMSETDYQIKFSVEDYYPRGIAAADLTIFYGIGYSRDYDASPGNITNFRVYEPPAILHANANQHEVWVYAAGSSDNYGGCELWVSWDDTTYSQIGTIDGSSRMGVLQSSITTTDDPDTTSWVVDLTTSRGEITGGSSADADAGATLVLVGDELLAYSTATLTGVNTYTLSAYTRRGMYSTSATTHGVSTQFIRCDDTVITLTFDVNKLGTTIYYKFVPFNVLLGGKPDLSACTAHSYVLGSGYTVSIVSGLTVQQQGAIVIINWTLGTADGYNVYWSDQTGSFVSATLLDSVGYVSQYITTQIPPGDKRIYVTAVSLGVESTPATYDITIT